jgi:uncharacterized DUF497 family protein
LDFDWDPDKRLVNIEKHGIDFRRAIEVFADRQHILEDSTRPEHGELRSKAIGRVDSIMMCVIFTDRGNQRRIISARRARRDEREQYRHSAENA